MKAILKVVRVRLHADVGYFIVEPEFVGVDRPYCSGWVVEEKLVKRLTAAIEGEAAKETNINVRTDIDGKTYVSFNLMVSGRTMNADLKRLGY